jgi:hypothetical protein
MSWSLSAKGTKAGAKAALAKQAMYGTSGDDEKAVFADVKGKLASLIDSAPDASGDYQTIVSVSASGHGANVGALSFSNEWVSMDPPAAAPSAPAAPPADATAAPAAPSPPSGATAP